jgi:FMN phosphatase YigB (HAD superfamily)
MSEFIKDDKTKVPLAILFDVPNTLEDVAEVMQYGANKYDRKNWSKCDDEERYVSATLRHLMAYQRGELADKESGLLHLAHAITSLMFLNEIEYLKP